MFECIDIRTNGAKALDLYDSACMAHTILGTFALWSVFAAKTMKTAVIRPLRTDCSGFRSLKSEVQNDICYVF